MLQQYVTNLDTPLYCTAGETRGKRKKKNWQYLHFTYVSRDHAESYRKRKIKVSLVFWICRSFFHLTATAEVLSFTANRIHDSISRGIQHIAMWRIEPDEIFYLIAICTLTVQMFVEILSATYTRRPTRYNLNPQCF